MQSNEIAPRWGPPSIDHKISDKKVNQILDYSYTVLPRSYATPSYAIFAATLFWIGSKKIRVKLFFYPQLRYLFLFPPSYAISSFSPPVKLFFYTHDALGT